MVRGGFEAVWLRFTPPHFAVSSPSPSGGSYKYLSTYVDTMSASASNQFMLVLSGGIGCLLGVCVFWCITENSPTTTAFVGALNKIPLTLLGSILFSAKIGTMGYVFIAMNLAGGFWYVYEKNQMSKRVQSGQSAGQSGQLRW